MLVISRSFQIPDSEIELTYVRSSGPGGQNVNKVNSKCQLRWNAQESASVPFLLRERLLMYLKSRLTRSGDLIVMDDSYRDQPRNREACFVKFKSLLLEAIHIPKQRKDTQPTRSSERRRANSKRKQSEKKSLRGRVGQS